MPASRAAAVRAVSLRARSPAGAPSFWGHFRRRRRLSRIVFFRDGRIVKRVKAPSLSWRAYEMTTVVPAGDHQLHTVLVRAYFVDGATPRVKAMVHRFAHCRSSEVVS